MWVYLNIKYSFAQNDATFRYHFTIVDVTSCFIPSFVCLETLSRSNLLQFVGLEINYSILITVQQIANQRLMRFKAPLCFSQYSRILPRSHDGPDACVSVTTSVLVGTLVAVSMLILCARFVLSFFRLSLAPRRSSNRNVQ